MFKVEMDIKHLQSVIEDAINKAVEKASFVNNISPLLTKTELMDLLQVSTSKATELFNRRDFPVIREFGHPRVPTALLFIWIYEHTDWVKENSSNPLVKKLLKGA